MSGTVVTITPFTATSVRVASGTSAPVTASSVVIDPSSTQALKVIAGSTTLLATTVVLNATPVPVPAESAAGTTITKPGGAPIVDSHGNNWNLVASAASGNQIAINNVVQTNTNNVVQLVYSNHQIWQNAWALWWYKGQPSDAWLPTAGQAAGPTGVVPAPTPTPTPAPAPSPNANPNVSASPVPSTGLTIDFEEDFLGTSMSSAWREYGTGASGTPPIFFNNAGISVNNGFTGKIWMDSSGQWYGPGMVVVKGWSPPYRVEWKVLVKPAAGIGPYFLLWPTNDQWPPEIDMMEYPAGSVGNSALTVTMHDMNNTNGGLSTTCAVDRTTWHVCTMDISNTGYKFWVNGVQQNLPANNWTTNSVTIPMSPGLGCVAFPNGNGWFGGTDGSTPNPYTFQVAYLRVWV